MRIAVYSIAKNEEQFVKRWALSAADADYRLILDTGSTDNTMSLAKDMGVIVYSKVFTPWRFDDARNYALSFLPDDIDMCIALDMDEVLVPGWRQHLEKISPETTRPRYKYIWSWNDDGSEGLVYAGDKIHSRRGYKWKHPVHEVLKPTGVEVPEWITDLVIEHHPDNTKSRSQYFSLLKLAVAEDPKDDRNRFYLGREHFFAKNYAEAEEQFREHLKLSKWAPERAASCRFLAVATGNKHEWLFKAISEDPSRRESWVDLAMLFYNEKDWGGCYWASKKALSIVEKPLDYLCEAYAWGYLAYDLGAVAAYNLTLYAEAEALGTDALSKSPDDKRLAANLEFYKQKNSPQNLG